MPENQQPVHKRLGERGRSPNRQQPPRRSLLQIPPIRPREASSQNREPPLTRPKYDKNFETDTPSESFSSSSNKNNRPSYYEPPSMTYGQMSKELKKHKSNAKNLAKINDDLKNKNMKLERDLSAEKKISGKKEEVILELKISNSAQEKQLAESENENKRQRKIIRELERENQELNDDLVDQQKIIKRYKYRLDKLDDENLRSFRKRRDGSDW